MRADGIFGIGRKKDNVIQSGGGVAGPAQEYMGEIGEPVWDCGRRLKMVFAGEIYDESRLRDSIRGDHNFRDRDNPSDNERVVHLIGQHYDAGEKDGLTEAVKKSVASLDGIYAAAVSDGRLLVLFRDPAGLKPLYYAVDDTRRSAGFASAKKALWNQGFGRVERVRPGTIVTVDLDSLRVTSFDDFALRPAAIPIEIRDHDDCLDQYEKTLAAAVRKRVKPSDDRLGILISGGVDSTLLTKLFYDIAVKESGLDLIGYTVGFENSSDLVDATKFARHFGITHRTRVLTADVVEAYLPKVITAVEDRDFVQVETSIIPYCAMELAAEDNIRTMIVGQGPDEMWGGYTWYPNYIREHGHDGFHEQLWEDFLLGDVETFERESKVARTFGIRLRYPYMDGEVVRVAMSAAPELKVSSPDDRMGKLVHRALAGRAGVPEEFAQKPKEAAQIGSGVHDVLDRVATKHGYSAELATNLNYSPEAVSGEKRGSSARYGYRYADNPSEWQLPANVCLYLDVLAYENGLLDAEMRDKIRAFVAK